MYLFEQNPGRWLGDQERVLNIHWQKMDWKSHVTALQLACSGGINCKDLYWYFN